MRSLFYTDNESDYVFPTEGYEALLKEANTLLSSVRCGRYTQAVIFFTSSGRMYSTVIMNVISKDKLTEKELIARMLADGDTVIQKIVAVWGKENEEQPPFDFHRMLCVDMPSYDFRKMLIELNFENANAMMLLNGGDKGYIQKPVKATMK